MNLYLITQGTNTGHYTYDSAVVAADSKQGAEATHPNGVKPSWGSFHDATLMKQWCISWTHPDNVEAELIGTTTRQAGLICSSFSHGKSRKDMLRQANDQEKR